MNFRLSENGLLKRVAIVLPFLALTLIAVLLWLPFGLHIGFYADDWLFYSGIQAGKFWGPALRPFLNLSWIVAYHLDSNSFVGVNLFVWFLILGKGVLFYLILCDLNFDQLFAFGTAVLVLLYPADSGVFYLGGLTIHETVFTFLLAVWLVIRFWKSGQRWLWLPLWISAGICLGSYEATFPLFLIVPAILVFMQRRITRRLIVVSLAWFLMPLIFGLRIVFTLLTKTSVLTYQQSIVANDRSLGALVGSVWRAIHFSLVDSWVSAFNQTIAPTGWSGFRNILKTMLNNHYWVYALIAALILIITMIVIRKYASTISISMSRLLWAALAGIVLIVLAFLPYTLSNLRNENLRTLLHASQGAALTLSVCLWLVGSLLRRIKFVYAALLTVLVVAGMSSLLYQHRSYVALGQQQILFMQNLVQTAPHFTPDSTIVVVDDTPDHRLLSTFTQLSTYLEGVVQVVYSDSTLSSIICYPHDSQPQGYDAESCRFEADSIRVSSQDGPSREWHYDQVVVFHYDTQHGLQQVDDLSAYGVSEQAQRLYAPDNRIDRASGLPIRAYTMLGLPISDNVMYSKS